MAMTIRIKQHEFEMSHTVHTDKQEWRKHLVMVAAVPNRLVGLVDPDEKDFSGGFMLYAACMYICELQFQPVVELDPETQQPIIRDGKPNVVGMNARSRLQILVPYDVMCPIDIHVWPSYMVRVHDQDESFKKWMFDQYLQTYDQPKVELATKLLKP